MTDSIKEALPKYGDLEKLPDNLVGEIIAGELYATPRPASPHARTASLLGSELLDAFDRGRGGPGGWWILFEPELRFDSDVVVPDIAGWRRDRMPQIPNVAAFEISPDWVCEVLSPSTVQIDRVRKMPLYAANGVGHMWLIDPIARVLEIYRLSGVDWILAGTYGEDATVRAEPFEEIELSLSSLWIDVRR